MEQKHVLALSREGFHKVAYVEWGNPDDPCPVVCVHGLTRNGRDFDRLAAALADAGRRVICPDIAGRGLSDRFDAAELYGYPQYCGDMASLIARLDTDAVDWVGTSMGGLIAMFLAQNRNAPIRRLVMNDIGPFIPQAFVARLRDYVGQAPEFPDLAAAETYLRKIHAPFGDLGDDAWRHLVNHGTWRLEGGGMVLAYDPKIATPIRAASAPADIDMWSFWPNVRMPVLLIRGVESDLLLPETVERMAADYQGDAFKVFEVADAGHAPALMDDEQIAAVRDWLAD